MGLFSSDYQNNMFSTFLNEYITGWKDGFSNPYQSFYEQGMKMDFPYPPVMLVIMSFGEGLCMLFKSAPLFLRNIVFKLPLLAFDFLVFCRLCKTYPEKKATVLLAYFSSPLILYSTYMHGQLDLIPMAFLFIGMTLLTELNTSRNFLFSSLFLSLAVLSKLHIVAVLPLVAIYIYKHYGLSKTIAYCVCITGMVFAGIMPFYGDGFINGVVFNTAQSTLFDLTLSFGDLKVYIALAAVVIAYLYTMNLNFINSDLLFGMAGLIFSIFLSLCAPMPGWYVWVVIFMADFLMRSNGYKNFYIYYCTLQLLYLVYFVFFHRAIDGAVDLYFLSTDCSFLKLDIPAIKSILFTTLTSMLVYIMFLMHRYCIIGNSMYHFHNQAFVIGICGDSGTGKSTLQDSISKMFSEKNFLRIEGDGDHKWERGDQNWENYTHLNPKANFLHRQAMDIRRLKNGETVQRVEYDHKTGHFTAKRTVRPCRFMSISGLHIFYLPQLRNIVDLKIYVEADEELRLDWKLGRDSTSRGHTKEDVIRQIESRKDDAQKYIHPQKEFADITIRYFPDGENSDDAGMELSINTKIDVEAVVSVLSDAGIELSYKFSEDFSYQIVEYRPSLNKSAESVDFSQLFVELFSHGYDILSQVFMVDDVADGIRKLIIVQAIHSKLRGEI